MRRVAASIVGLFFGTLLLVGLKSTAFAPPGSLVAGAPQDPGGSPGATTGPASSPGRLPAGQPTPTHAPPGGPTQPGQSPRPGQSTTTTMPGGGGTTTTTTTTSASTNYVGSAASVPTATSPNAPRSGGTCGECHNYAISVTITVSGGQIIAASYAYSVDPGGSRSYANRGVPGVATAAPVAAHLEPRQAGLRRHLRGQRIRAVGPKCHAEGRAARVTDDAPRLYRRESVMGTLATVVVYDPVPRDGLLDETFAWLHEVDARFSTYKQESEICRLDRGELRPEQSSADVQAVLDTCADLWRRTDGFFDIYATGRLDPSGYVKGWSVQVASQRLTAAGAVNHYVEAGGDLQTHGRPAPGRQWEIGIATRGNGRRSVWW